jgi:hypothetical protein
MKTHQTTRIVDVSHLTKMATQTTLNLLNSIRPVLSDQYGKFQWTASHITDMTKILVYKEYLDVLDTFKRIWMEQYSHIGGYPDEARIRKNVEFYKGLRTCPFGFEIFMAAHSIASHMLEEGVEVQE